MKHSIFLFITIIFIACNKNNENPRVTSPADSLSMQANYEYDVYYSLENGIASEESRINWDIAFSTGLRTAGILINEAQEIKLFTLGDTLEWNSADTAGLHSRIPLSNNESDWLFGAFNQNQGGISFTGSNYGWATYYFSGNPEHNVVSDSIYAIKLADNSWKKIWVVIKLGQTNTYVLKFANLDGTNEQIDSIHCNEFLDKNYIYYSIGTKEIIDREPESANWDLIFTRYYTLVNQGPLTMNQLVTGVLTNYGIETAKVAGVDPSVSDYTNAGFLESNSVIGYDWKQFDHISQSYSIVDNLSYFLKKDDIIYKLVFTGFDNATGKIKFLISVVQE